MTADRIAILLHDFAPGGSERIAVRLRRNEWARQGRMVTLIVGNRSGALRRMVGADVTVIAAEPPVKRGWGMRRRLARRLSGLIVAARPQLLFVPGNYHFPVVARFARRGERPSIVAKLSNPVARKGRPWLAQTLLDAMMRVRLGRIEAVVAMSPALAADTETFWAAAALSRSPSPACPISRCRWLRR